MPLRVGATSIMHPYVFSLSHHVSHPVKVHNCILEQMYFLLIKEPPYAPPFFPHLSFQLQI